MSAEQDSYELLVKIHALLQEISGKLTAAQPRWHPDIPQTPTPPFDMGSTYHACGFCGTLVRSGCYHDCKPYIPSVTCNKVDPSYYIPPDQKILFK